MKNIVAINSSKRKMNTYKLLCETRGILKDKDINLEIVSLYDLNIKDCIGCEKCIITDSCVLNDDAFMLMEKLANADGIILSSPVYLQQVSGKLKTFIDRTCKWFHRPVLYGKPILFIATTKGSGLKTTLNYMESLAVQWGAIPSEKIGRNIRNINEEVREDELKDFLKYLDNPSLYKPNFSSLMNFQVQKALAQHLIGEDTKYWQSKNWNNKPFYYNCKIPYFSNLIASNIGKTMTKRMKKATIK